MQRALAYHGASTDDGDGRRPFEGSIGTVVVLEDTKCKWEAFDSQRWKPIGVYV